MSESTAGRKGARWPTLNAPLPIVEASRALEHGGTNGLAIYEALHVLRFLAPPQAKSKFFASMAQISHRCGISERRLRAPLRQLEAAGLVKIDRPRGAARVAHQAFQYSLIPVFTADNKIRARPDKSSAPDGTNRPVRTGHELGSNLSDNSESPQRGTLNQSPPRLRLCPSL
jgi:DNA-binding IscR family transcriptional regulator